MLIKMVFIIILCETAENPVLSLLLGGSEGGLYTTPATHAQVTSRAFREVEIEAKPPLRNLNLTKSLTGHRLIGGSCEALTLKTGQRNLA